MDLYIFKHKSYCIPSDFLEHIQSFNHTHIIVNSSPSTVKTGRWLSIFQTGKNIEFINPIALPYTFYMTLIKNLCWAKGKIYYWKLDTSTIYKTKNCGFHTLLYFIFLMSWIHLRWISQYLSTQSSIERLSSWKNPFLLV